MAKGNEVVQWMDRVIAQIRTGKDLGQMADQVQLMAKWCAVSTRLWQIMPGATLDGVKITRFSVKRAPRSPGNLMLVIQGTKKKESVVAFHTGEPGAELFDGFQQKAKSKGIKWQPDKPFEAETPEVEREALPALGGC